MASIDATMTMVGSMLCEPPPGGPAAAYARSGKSIDSEASEDVSRAKHQRMILHNARKTEPGMARRRRPRPPRGGRRAHVARDAKEEGHVWEREEPIRQELARHEEVAQVGAREAAARVARAFGVQRRSVLGVARLVQGQQR